MSNTENPELLMLCEKYKKLRNAQRGYIYKIQTSPFSEYKKVNEELNEIEQELDLFVEGLTEKTQEK